MIGESILDRSRVSSAVNALDDDAVLIVDLKVCPNSPRIIQELEILTTLQPRRMDGDVAQPTLYWMDIASMPLDLERTWIPGVPILVTMKGVSLGIQAATDAKRMVEAGVQFKQLR